MSNYIQLFSVTPLNYSHKLSLKRERHILFNESMEHSAFHTVYYLCSHITSSRLLYCLLLYASWWKLPHLLGVTRRPKRYQLLGSDQCWSPHRISIPPLQSDWRPSLLDHHRACTVINPHLLTLLNSQVERAKKALLIQCYTDGR